jgi:hypothetical protein
MIERLSLVIHWLGFVCILIVVSSGVILPTLTATGFYSFLFIAIAAWPIKYILTGDSTVLPWQKKYAWTLRKGVYASENED